MREFASCKITKILPEVNRLELQCLDTHAIYYFNERPEHSVAVEYRIGDIWTFELKNLFVAVRGEFGWKHIPAIDKGEQK